MTSNDDRSSTRSASDSFTVVEASGISSQKFGERLMHSGVVSQAEITSAWDNLPKESRSAGELARVLVSNQKLTPFHASVLAKGESTPLVLGGYVIQDKLGEGGMG